MQSLENQLQAIIRKTDLIRYLEAIREAKLPDAWLGAGAVRNTVWRYLHGDSCHLTVNDLDVLYIEEGLIEPKDREYEKRLEEIHPTGKWECVNQIFMIRYGNDPNYWLPNLPYHTIEDSMHDWTFTASAVCIRLTKENKIEILAPYGLEDIFSSTLRRTISSQNDHRLYIKKFIQKMVSQCSHFTIVDNADSSNFLTD